MYSVVKVCADSQQNNFFKRLFCTLKRAIFAKFRQKIKIFATRLVFSHFVSVSSKTKSTGAQLLCNCQHEKPSMCRLGLIDPLLCSMFTDYCQYLMNIIFLFGLVFSGVVLFHEPCTVAAQLWNPCTSSAFYYGFTTYL